MYTDEGHGFVRPENRLDLIARAEKFLADNLGGRYEPMKGDRIPGSTAKIRVVGASQIGSRRDFRDELCYEN